jgi:O-antigen ligase
MKRRGNAAVPRAPYAALLVLLVLLPLPFGANRDWIWPWFALATFALAFVHATAVLTKRWPLGRGVRASRVFIALLALWAASGFAYAMAAVLAAPGDFADPDAVLREALRQAFYATIAWLVLATVDSRRRLVGLLAALFIAGVLQALWGTAMTLSGVEWGAFGTKIINRGVATGTFVNRNHLAGYLALTGALGVGLLAARFATSTAAASWRERVRGWLRWLLGPGAWTRVALALLVVGLILTRSRMGNLAFFVALAAAGLSGLLLVRPLPRQLLVLLVSILAIDALLIGSWFGIEQVAKRVAATTVAREGPAGGDSDAERVDVSAATFALWREHPHFGVGPGGFRTAFPTVKPASVQLFYDHAHNDWVELLAERGWTGALLWLALSGFAASRALRALRRADDSRTRGIALGCIGALAAAAVHASVDFNAQIPAYAAAVFALLAASVLAAALRPRNTGVAPRTVNTLSRDREFLVDSGT